MPNALEIMGLTLVEGAKFGSGLLLYFENYFFLTKVKNAPAAVFKWFDRSFYDQ